jgi:hypothetical protein
MTAKNFSFIAVFILLPDNKHVSAGLWRDASADRKRAFHLPVDWNLPRESMIGHGLRRQTFLPYRARKPRGS